MSLAPEQVLAAIIGHGLAVRMVPREVVHLREMQHFKEGCTVVEQENKQDWAYSYAKRQVAKHGDIHGNYRFDDKNKRVFRRYARSVTIPNHAGWWMCQANTGTSSKVQWAKKEHHLAPTLTESVVLFLRSLPDQT